MPTLHRACDRETSRDAGCPLIQVDRGMRGPRNAVLPSARAPPRERYSSRIVDVLTHVIMHSAYHRGQIASDIRADGGEPAYTDFIHAVRQRFITLRADKK